MISKIDNIADVWRFISQISTSEFTILNAQKHLCIQSQGGREQLLQVKCEIVEPWRNGYLINESLFFHDKKLEPLFSNHTYKSLIVSDEQLLVKSIDYEKEEIRYGIFDFLTKEIEWLVGFGGSTPCQLVHNRSLISITENEIRSHSIDQGDSWEKPFRKLVLSETANLYSCIFRIEEKLFFVITGTEKKGLVVLDIKSGDILAKFDNVSYELFQDGDYIYSSQFENVLCRINAKTLKLETWDCNAIIKENGFHSIHDHRCDVKSGKFCFTQTLGDNKAKVGVLDWEKRELIYKHDFEPENGGIGSIQVDDNRMFVHTQDNILHIFQRD